ncbi:MAG: Pyrroline-5-carboxylate reductase [Firmicutes bacterium]|nr:Pyrroline-5-carboxylate reductase [Bacillota bacterium]MDI6705039.1 pyrroline-5-carboxylate reductase [Bacillota bacterium]
MLYNKLGFIGAGSIVHTMIDGLIRNETIKSEKIWVTNKENTDRLLSLWKKYDVNCTKDKNKVLDSTDVIILAVKPQDTMDVLREIKPVISDKQLLISVVAGVTCEKIESYLQKDIAVIRVMPNISCAIGESATAVSRGKYATERHLNTACTLFEALGEVVVVDEANMDIITGLSGSGPAYFYYMVELMEKTAIAAGLSEEVAKKLLLQTLYGAAKMLRDSNEDPSSLRKKVTSPEGTTKAALEVFQAMGLEETVQKAVIKAAARSRELGLESVR